MNEIKNPYELIQKIVDTQDNLVVVIENEEPVLVNKSFRSFFGVSSFEQYCNDFGAFINNFVPHPSYFHAEKVTEGETWVQSLVKLEDKDKIVSMLNLNHEPRAFSVNLDDTHEVYTVLSLEDISANLIKRIMIEHHMNMDEITGAYTKDYFLHTAEILKDGAAYNEKDIGLSLIHIFDATSDELSTAVTEIKAVIRQNDMLVKYSRDTLILAYLVDKKDNAILFTRKIHSLMKSGSSCAVVDLVSKREKIPQAIDRLKIGLESLSEDEMKVL